MKSQLQKSIVALAVAGAHIGRRCRGVRRDVDSIEDDTQASRDRAGAGSYDVGELSEYVTSGPTATSCGVTSGIGRTSRLPAADDGGVFIAINDIEKAPITLNRRTTAFARRKPKTASVTAAAAETTCR